MPLTTLLAYVRNLLSDDLFEKPTCSKSSMIELFFAKQGGESAA